MNRWMARVWLWAAPLLVGCGVQAHMGPHQATLDGGQNEFVTIAGYERDLTTHGFTIYDTTGIFLSALTGLGSVQQAVNRGGGTAVMRAPVPGLMTTFEYTVGSTEDFHYRLGAARMNVHTWDVGDGDSGHQLGWGLGFYGISYRANGNTEDAWALPISLAYTVPLLLGLSATGSVSLDPVNPVLAGVGGKYWFSYEASARLDWMPLDWLGAFALAQMRQTPADLGETQTNDQYLQFGLMVMLHESP